MNKPTILIDSREKQPYNFSKDHITSEIIKLDTGDYTIKGYENEICIERKKNGLELLNNITGKGKAKAFRSELQRMKNIKHVFVVVEQSLEDFLNPQKYFWTRKLKNKAPAILLGYITSLMLRNNIHFIFGGNRSYSIVKNILMKFYEHQQETARTETLVMTTSEK